MAFALAVTALVLAPPAPAAAADARTLYINSAAWGKAGSCSLGDDRFNATSPASNSCSLGAALNYANIYSSAANPILVTLASGFAAAGGGQITVPDSVSNSSADVMVSGGVNNDLTSSSRGAFYGILAPMTVDLQNKLAIVSPKDVEWTSVWVSANGAKLLNFSNIQNGMTAIGVSGTARDILIQGGVTLPISGNYTQQFLVIANGAENITFKDYTVGNLKTASNTNCNSAAVCFTPDGQKSLAARNVIIDNVTFTTTHNPLSSSYTCSSSNSSGCVNNSIVLNDDANINGLEVKNSYFANLKKDKDSDPVVFGSYFYSGVVLSNFYFHDNAITDSGSCVTDSHSYCTLIALPHDATAPLGGVNRISNNRFVNNVSLEQPHAVSTYLANTGSNNTALSNLWIENNYFDGFASAAIWLQRTGIATVSGNTFGKNTYSNATTTTEETASSGTGKSGAMFANESNASNKKATTWYPSAAALFDAGASCGVELALQAPASSAPATPVVFDVYWTAGITAERYIGRSGSAVTGSAATVAVELPADLVSSAGAVSGYLRVQTQSLAYGQASSTQYSRTVAVTGACHKLAVNSVSPTTGAVQGGDLIAITGTGFSYLKPARPLFITFDGALCQNLRVISDTKAECTAPPSVRAGSRTGQVDLWAFAGSYLISDLPQNYLYVAAGNLKVEKKAWRVDAAAVAGLSPQALWAAVRADPAAAEVPAGGAVNAGEVIVWTYTLSYVYLVGGSPYGGAADIGLTDVKVADDKLGEVCRVAVAPLNTLVGCAAAGTVT
ncbi:MAG: IPT/TIG domain-containing protein [Propionibacteriaceae bacterium]|nr:IPT/TIG domain-containing protein [Propionibacteriaceae bacterium]